MTSKQTVLMFAALWLGGCAVWPREAESLPSPYAERRVLAVAPLHNESGSLHADGYLLADGLVRQFEGAGNIDVLPLNRTLAAMQALEMPIVGGPDDVQKLLAALGADALVVGSVTSFDPYDPPKMGMTLELYLPRQGAPSTRMDLRELTRAATGEEAGGDAPADADRPVSLASAYFDAANPEVRRALRRYAFRRGSDVGDEGWRKYSPFESPADSQSERLYRINMDLFSEFVSYQMSWRLLEAEARRLTPAQVARNGT